MKGVALRKLSRNFFNMNKNISNPLEQLEQIPGGVVGQVTNLPKAILSGGVKSLMGKKVKPATKTDPLTGLAIPTDQQVQELRQQEVKQKMSGLAVMRQTLSQSPKNPQNPEPPKYVSGKPGFDLDKAMGLDPFKKEKKELPPPIAAVKQKHSTGERKHGVGG